MSSNLIGSTKSKHAFKKIIERKHTMQKTTVWHELYDKALSEMHNTCISESEKKNKARKIADRQTREAIQKKQMTNIIY